METGWSRLYPKKELKEQVLYKIQDKGLDVQPLASASVIASYKQSRCSAALPEYLQTQFR